jgi:hypothetical protein
VTSAAILGDVFMTDGAESMPVSAGTGTAVDLHNLGFVLKVRLDRPVVAKATTRFPDLVVTPMVKLAQPNVTRKRCSRIKSSPMFECTNTTAARIFRVMFFGRKSESLVSVMSVSGKLRIDNRATQ